MKYLVLIIIALSALAFAGCGQQPTTNDAANKESDVNWQVKADGFLEPYLDEFAKLELRTTEGYWKAANSGKKEDFDAYAQADLDLKKFHSNADSYATIVELLGKSDQLEPLTVRSLQVAELSFKGNQLPPDILEKMSVASSKIEQTFGSFRAKLGEKEYPNNELLEDLGKETDSQKRQEIWEALKQVGEAVGDDLIELAKIRNEGAQTLGYKNYWEMQIKLQEHDPAQIMAIFDELEEVTNAPFAAMKKQLDAELAARFKIKPEQMMPWHYDSPFFQDAPPSAKVNMDDFYNDKDKEEIVKLSTVFFNDIELPNADIVANSDLYERDGKDQHAFCIAIDRDGLVRTLTNVRPTAQWMATTLHEQGHALYYKYLDYEVPFNLREAAHTLTTEGIAMLFGALAGNPTWLVDYAGADKAMVAEKKEAILEQRRREQLIFARWTMVMLNFEKALYENPDQDLNKLWWDNVERYQMLKRPEGRNNADWAAKPHFTIAPVYYHNYMLGELYAAQLRSALAQKAGHTGAASDLSFTGRKDFGKFLIEKVFRQDMIRPWPQFVEDSTGTPLSCDHFVSEL